MPFPATDDVEVLVEIDGFATVGGFGGAARCVHLRVGAALPELTRSNSATRHNGETAMVVPRANNRTSQSFLWPQKGCKGGERLQSDQVNPDTPATVNTKPRDRTYMEQRPQGLGRVGEVGVGSGGWERQDLHCAKHPSNRLIIVEQFGCVHYP